MAASLITRLGIFSLTLTAAFAQPLEPFAVNAKATPALKPAAPFQKALDAFGSKNAGSWKAAGMPAISGQKLFALEQSDGKDALRLVSKAFEPGQTFVAYFPAADALKTPPNYVSFLSKTTGTPVDVSVYLVAGGASDSPAVKVTVPATSGAWQRVEVPVAQFAMKPGTRVQGVGFGIAGKGAAADVLIADLSLGYSPVSADSLKAQRTVISLKPQWLFAPESGDVSKWATPDFDDSKWKAIKAGFPWQDQGIDHSGWSWYRQKILVPKEAEGAPLTVVLTEIPYEDEVYFNGTKIGGLIGNYPYHNLLLRTYTVPSSLIRYGEPNTIAIRTWGTLKGGLIAGMDPKGTYFQATLDRFTPTLRTPGGQEQTADHFDLSAAQQGMPFEIVLRFPSEVLKGGSATLSYTLTDYYDQALTRGSVPIVAGKGGAAEAVVPVDAETSRTIYLRGRFKAFLSVADAAGAVVAVDAREFDRISFATRDAKSLPALSEKIEDTPYGKLKLVDEIDCSLPASQDEHPYMQSGASHAQTRNTPGADLKVPIREILGKKAREIEGPGFFAYRIGRGKLQIHKNYLLRVEYPEDKPRYVPIEIQSGHSFMDIGWKNGVSADDPYDNWPLTNSWQWYDAVFSLDEETTGTSGTGGSSAEHGVWVYFMNRKKEGRYFERYQGGPAIARIKLYEIDPEKNAPAITLPKGDPQRVLMVDWERQADQPPEDIVRYAKLMGYSAIAPIMLKWHFMNYGEPLSGYDTTIVDDMRYWVRKSFAGEADNETPAPEGDSAAETVEEKPPVESAPVPASAKAVSTLTSLKPSVHRQYLDLTKKYGLDYVPRIEYGGSLDLPIEARAINAEGEFAKPNRFATWSANLLHPATWEDLARTVDSYFKPYVKDNPQLTGMLWRIRCDRMQISFGRGDIELFAKETGTKLPENLSAKELAAWAALSEVAEAYADWWHQKRADFHAKLVTLLKSYRSDMTLYYFNWDGDKWSIGFADFTTALYFAKVAGARFGLVSKVYEKDYRERRAYTDEDYIRMIRTGQINEYPGWGRDWGLHTELYKDTKGIQLFAPVSWLYLADNPAYINYFKTADGVAVSNIVSYDEAAMRSINPKFECNVVTPGGAPFSMALEVLAWFHADPRTLTYTVYTYGRGFADAHRRFAQAFRALPALPGTVVDQGDKDLKVRTYAGKAGTYVGVAYKGYAGKKLTVKIPGVKAGAKLKDLVTGQSVPVTADGGDLQFEIASGPMELNAYLIE